MSYKSCTSNKSYTPKVHWSSVIGHRVMVHGKCVMGHGLWVIGHGSRGTNTNIFFEYPYSAIRNKYHCPEIRIPICFLITPIRLKPSPRNSECSTNHGINFSCFRISSKSAEHYKYVVLLISYNYIFCR